MPKLIASLIIALVIAPAALALGAELADLERENAALESEIALAKKKDNYLIFDLAKMRVEVRSQGLVLKSIGIAELRIWHEYKSMPRTYLLLAKEASGEPKRNVIKPKSADEAKPEPPKPLAQETFDVQAMEIDDMPTSYRLTLDGGLRLYVRQSGGWLRDTAHTMAWYMGQSFSAGWSKLRGRQYDSIEMSLAERDAQALYWAFLVNTSCIVK